MPGLTEAFVAAAGRAQQSGFDLVCLHMAHGTLLHQFLTPLANQRPDEYGHDLEGRMRLPLGIVQEVRARLGPGIVLSCRISSEDGVEGGLGLSDTCEISRRLKGAGADLLDVSYGIQGSMPLTSPTQQTPLGCFIPLAAKIREAAGPPVIVAGKIWNPHLAEEAVRTGKADLVALSRPLLADPDLPRKWREGRPGQVRACLSDNQGCLARLYQDLEVRCSVNPSLGREPSP
jgi:2,4-dienoyl-CoA reductase-like NADH-dependent reductase (Old Yellow Enzyme family)